MHAQLVRAPGDRLELQAAEGVGARSVAIEHAIARERTPAAQRVDDLAGAIVRVLGQRQVDLAAVLHDMPVHHRYVLLADDALLEGETHAAQHLRAAREQHQAGGGGVEAVHDAGVGPARLDPRRQAVVTARPARGHGEQAGWLVGDDKELIDVEDGDREMDFRLHEALFRRGMVMG